MASTLKPKDAKQVEEAVSWALSVGEPAGDRRPSKQACPRSVLQVESMLDLSGLSGVIDYEPAGLYTAHPLDADSRGGKAAGREQPDARFRAD